MLRGFKPPVCSPSPSEQAVPAAAGDVAVGEIKPPRPGVRSTGSPTVVQLLWAAMVQPPGMGKGAKKLPCQSQLCYPVGPARPQEKQIQGK